MAVPAKMPVPTEGSATTFDRIEVDWLEMTTMEETGGTYAIVSYNLQISIIADTWADLVGGSAPYLGLSHLEEGLTTGTDYKFRIRASNSFGWGPYSDVVTIRADEVPAQITAVMTTADSIYARIGWSLPSTDNGSPVLEYKIQILESDGVTYSESASCDGLDIELLNSAEPSCLVSFSELRALPFSLTQGTIVKAIVQAKNINGWNPQSNVNTEGVTIQTEPHTMSAPWSIIAETSQS